MDGSVQYYIEDMLMGELSLYSDRSVKKMDIGEQLGEHVLWSVEDLKERFLPGKC